MSGCLECGRGKSCPSHCFKCEFGRGTYRTRNMYICYSCNIKDIHNRLYYPEAIKQGDCLVFSGHRDNKGYGRLSVNGIGTLAHRVAWFLVYNQWPLFDLNHKCENTGCIKVSHLEDVTKYEHNQFTFRRYSNRKCPRGHNKTFYPSKGKYGQWDCRTCNADRMAKRGDWK